MRLDEEVRRAGNVLYGRSVVSWVFIWASMVCVEMPCPLLVGVDGRIFCRQDLWLAAYATKSDAVTSIVPLVSRHRMMCSLLAPMILCS